MESNIGLFLTYCLSIILMIGVPVALAIFFIRRFKVSWWVILVGALAYIASQVVHYPVLKGVSALFNNGTLPIPSQAWIPLFNALILGFLAALFEEGFRYLSFWILRITPLKRKTKRVESAVGMGIGQGGMEAIGFAVWPYFPIYSGILISFLYMLFYNAGGQLAKGISSSQVQAIVSQIAQFWTNPWYLGFLPGIERLIAFSTQIFLSILVWKSVRNRSFWWFLLAFFYHMLITGVSVFLQYSGWGYWSLEGIMAIFMVANLYLIYYFWKEEHEEREKSDQLVEGEVEGEPVDEDEFLDEEDDDEFDEEDELDEDEEEESDDDDEEDEDDEEEEDK